MGVIGITPVSWRWNEETQLCFLVGFIFGLADPWNHFVILKANAWLVGIAQHARFPVECTKAGTSSSSSTWFSLWFPSSSRNIREMVEGGKG